MTTPNKGTRILYWISTGLLALFILSGIFFLNSTMALEGTKHLGMPLWFHYELGIAKFIGGLVLILPFFSKRIKEWAYVGFGIDFISAMIALIAVDGPQPASFFPLVTMVLLVISYNTYHKLHP